MSLFTHVTRCMIGGIVALLPIGGTVLSIVWLEVTIAESWLARQPWYLPASASSQRSPSIRDRRFLDATATHRNRGPENLARYGILVEFADIGAFGPYRFRTESGERPSVRPPDAAMRAMGAYLWSLDIPTSPYPFDGLARRGAEVFADEGCRQCHPAPLYTTNELVLAPGFEPDLRDPRWQGLPIADQRVDTDPGMAVATRKGTGFYRVPSLRGLWYRGLYGHSGEVAKLEDWFDAARLRDDYVPTGWRGPGVERRAVRGHEFGLDLSSDDKRALVAFLRTL